MINISTQEHICTISINNPKAKNALTPQLFADLHAALRQAADDDDVRVIILTGEGADFCAGAALQGLEDIDDISVYLKQEVNPAIMLIRSCPKPFIAQVRGVCVGVGFNYALACDLIHADSSARFSQIFTKIGLSSDGGGAYFFPQRLGHQHAFELMTSASMISAADALRLRLVNEVHLPDDLADEVWAAAQRLASGPYLAIQRTKLNLYEGEHGTLASTLALEADHQTLNFRSEDFAEGVKAFQEKRHPHFQGK